MHCSRDKYHILIREWFLQKKYASIILLALITGKKNLDKIQNITFVFQSNYERAHVVLVF